MKFQTQTQVIDGERAMRKVDANSFRAVIDSYQKSPCYCISHIILWQMSKLPVLIHNNYYYDYVRSPCCYTSYIRHEHAGPNNIYAQESAQKGRPTRATIDHSRCGIIKWGKSKKVLRLTYWIWSISQSIEESEVTLVYKNKFWTFV